MNPFAFSEQILITSKFNAGNRYVLELVSAVRKFTHDYQIYCEPKAFWSPNPSYGIVHIQWIEELFPDWEISSEQQLDELEKTLLEWKKHSKIVLTLHNHIPHSDTELMKRAYQIVHKHVDAVIHLDSWSEQRYLIDKRAAIIPHLNYQYREQYGKRVARRYFGIEDEEPVILVFGAVRNDDEKERIINLQKAFSNTGVKWLIPRWQYSGSKFQKVIDKLQFKFNKSLFVDNKWVGEHDVAYYFEAADIVLIPRGNVLNSGNLVLGYNFGKVVVGPSFGNVGAILSNTDNPTFFPNDVDSQIKALQKGLKLAETNQGKTNQYHSKKYWDRNKIGVKTLSFYQELFANADA